MDEKEFMEMLISERMAMHHDKFNEDYPPTPNRCTYTVMGNKGRISPGNRFYD